MKRFERKTKIILIIVITLIALTLIGLCVFWSISIYHQNYALWLAEYNAQMDQFGFYKKDINVLDQQKEILWVILQAVLNTSSYIATIILAIISYAKVNDYFYERRTLWK